MSRSRSNRSRGPDRREVSEQAAGGAAEPGADVRGEGKNAYVTGINGREADTKKKEYWAFYVNGKPATVGAGSYILKQADKIEWKIENY